MNESSEESDSRDMDAESSGSSGSGGPAPERQPAAKRARVANDGVVMISSVGDQRPDEILMDTMAKCFLNFGMSVTNCVLVPDFSKQTLFLANYEHDAYDKTRPPYRYVKKMLPRTSFLEGIECDVMILLGHGGARRVNVEKKTKTPYYMSFRERGHVSAVSGRPKTLGATPVSSIIWSCSSYNDGVNEYTKPDDGVTLSSVVGQSRLVVLLCCCGRNIIEEYSSEMRDGNKPDLVVFNMDSDIHDITANIFLVLLISTLEPKKVPPSPWHEFFKRGVCHVLVWIKHYGSSADEFWKFLETNHYIRMRGSRTPSYRIKGNINNYTLENDEKHLVWLEFQSLTLLHWRPAVGDTLGSYDWDDARARTAQELSAFVFTAPFRKASAPAAGSASQLDAMLLELKGLLRGA